MTTDGHELLLPLGLYDDPSRQRKANFSYDLYNSNLAVFGSALSGKTTLLKSLLIRIHQVSRREPQDKKSGLMDEQIYILDFGNTLQEYDNLPCVSACLSGMIDENVRRIFKIMEDIYNYNLLLRQNQKPIEIHTTFIIDGLDSFMEEERYNRYQDSLIRIARDGLSSKISIITTAAQYTGKMLKLRASAGCVIALDLPADVYSTLYPHKVSKPIQKQGRGVVNIGTAVYEFQAYLPYDIQDKSVTEAKIIKDVVAAYLFEGEYAPYDADENVFSEYRDKYKSRKLKKMPIAQDFTLAELNKLAVSKKYCRDKNAPQIPVGMDFYSFEKITLEIQKNSSIALYGSRVNAKNNLLNLILKGLIGFGEGNESKWGKILFWDDGSQTLQTFLKEYGYLNDKTKDHQVMHANSRGEFLTILDCFVDLKTVLGKKAYQEWVKDNDQMLNMRQRSLNVNKNGKEPLIVLIQSKEYFLTTSAGAFTGFELFSNLLRYSNFNRDLLYIFTNIPMLASRSGNKEFESTLNHAFLLDDIIPFVSGNGSTTNFASYSVKELNEMFGLCEESDGFYMNIEAFDLHKVRFLQKMGG